MCRFRPTPRPADSPPPPPRGNRWLVGGGRRRSAGAAGVVHRSACQKWQTSIASGEPLCRSTCRCHRQTTPCSRPSLVRLRVSRRTGESSASPEQQQKTAATTLSVWLYLGRGPGVCLHRRINRRRWQPLAAPFWLSAAFAPARCCPGCQRPLCRLGSTTKKRAETTL